ncbi:pectinesterase inhibitor [Capsella rubella]|nr:pectinesterase inhibitor [Capsella rubella]
MEPYKVIVLIGVTVCCYTFSGVQAIGRSVEDASQAPASSPEGPLLEPPVSSISAVPASAPSPTSEDIGSGPSTSTTETSAPGPSEEDIDMDIDIDFDSVTNIADLAPKFEHITKFDFSSMKIDTTAKDLCKNTDYNNECIAAILPDLRKRDGGSGGFEAKDVMRMEAESLFKKAKATLDYAKRVMEDSKTPMPVKEAMSVCVENYDSLISGLEDAKTAMDDGDYGRLDSVLSAAISDVSTCSDNFVDIPGVDSPTASLDELMKKLCSNVLAMSQKVQNR